MRAILTYHSVDGSGSPISISEAAFRAHLAWLTSGAVRVMPLEALAADDGAGDAVALTFDDGFANFAALAWPLLRDGGLPATVFVVSGHAGGSNAWGGRDAPGIPTLPLMDWDAVARVADEGATLGAHTRSHPDLRRVDDARLADELAGAAADIAARTGRTPAAFAYPYGAHDGRVSAAAAATYRLACTTDLRPLRRHEEPLQLPRLDTFYLQDTRLLARFGTPAFRRRLALRSGLRRARAALRDRTK